MLMQIKNQNSTGCHRKDPNNQVDKEIDLNVIDNLQFVVVHIYEFIIIYMQKVLVVVSL